MLHLFKLFYKKRKYKAHLLYLMKVCSWGENFCMSDIYTDQLEQLQNIKINNKAKNANSINFGNNCNVSCAITLNEKGTIDIGDYVFMNFVKMRIDHNLKIGTHCLFGPNVTLWDTDNHPISASARWKQAEEIAYKFPLSKSYEANGGDIVIEDNVWIGMDVLVLGGVTIGKGAVVAAKSVVTKDVLPFTIMAGIPAKKVGDVPF